jgi:hypothetical protein
VNYDDAIRVAEKIRPWIPQSQREWTIALDTLIAGVKGKSEPKPRHGTYANFLREMGKIKTEIKTAFDGFAEDIVGPDLPEDSPEPDRHGLARLRAQEQVLRLLQRTAFVEGWEQARMHYGSQDSTFREGEREFHGAECEHHRNVQCTCDDAAAHREATEAANGQYPDPQPVTPKVGDPVPSREAAKLLPVGTIIEDKAKLRGIVSVSGATDDARVVRWTAPVPEVVWPATILVVG